MNFGEACAKIESIIADSFADTLGGKPAGQNDASYYSWIAAIVDTLASEYGWSEEQILNIPLTRVWQYLRIIKLRTSVKNEPMFNRSDKVRGAWLAARRMKGGGVIDQLATAPLVFPAIVLGVAFLQLFVNAPIAIYGTLTSLVIASTVQYLPYGMRFSHAGALQIARELEEAGAVCGAGGLQSFRRIVLPLMAPAVTTAWLFVLLLSVRSIGLPSVDRSL